MAELVKRALLASALALGLCACDSGDGGTDAGTDDVLNPADPGKEANITPDPGADLAVADVPYVVPNPDGKAHGEVCTSDADCWFERCIAAPSVTGGAFRICTKDCSSGPNAPCALESATTGQYTCVRFSGSSGDDLSSFCMPTCSSAADCPTGYDDCRIVAGALKTCAMKAP
jgi:hypothetical protein